MNAKLRPLLYLGALVFPLLAFVSIARFAVNVPFWDEWEFPGLMQRVDEGELSLGQLAWIQRGEHRKVFPHLIGLGLARLTDFNVVAVIWFSFALRLVSLLLVWRLLVWTAVGDDLVPALTLLASCLLFSASEFENWAWGESAVMMALINLPAVAMVWGLARWPGRWAGFLVALAAATVASFSSASGLLLWPIGGIGLLWAWWRERRPRSRWLLTAWIVAAAALVGLFFAGYHSGYQSAPSFRPFLPMMKRYALYALTFLGSPLSLLEGHRWAAASSSVGLMVLAGAAYRLRKSGYPASGTVGPWALFVLFGALAATVTAVGRAGFGFGQALHGRYVATSSLFWIGLLAVVACGLPSGRRSGTKLRLDVVLATLLIGTPMLAGYCMSYARGLEAFRSRSHRMSSGLVYLRHHKTAQDHELAYLYPDAAALREKIRILEESELGVFAPSARRAAGSLFASPPGGATDPGAAADPGYPVLTAGETYLLDIAPGFPPDLVAWHSVVVGGRVKETLFINPPASVRWTATLPDAARIVLETDLVHHPRAWRVSSGDGVVFLIEIEPEGETAQRLISHTVDAGRRQSDRRWIPVTLELTEYAGRRVAIRLTTDAGPAGNSDADWSGWALPRLVSWN